MSKTVCYLVTFSIYSKGHISQGDTEYFNGRYSQIIEITGSKNNAEDILYNIYKQGKISHDRIVCSSMDRVVLDNFWKVGEKLSS